MCNKQSAQVGANGSDGDENKEPPIPPAIEDITDNDNEKVLQEKLVFAASEGIIENKPIEQEYYRQENGKLEGVEQHRYKTD